jgi:hypothetical protein
MFHGKMCSSPVGEVAINSSKGGWAGSCSLLQDLEVAPQQVPWLFSFAELP